MGRVDGRLRARSRLDLFDELVLGNDATRTWSRGDLYTHETYYMGLVDAAGRVDLLRRPDPRRRPRRDRARQYAPADYRDWIAERVEPWTYLKFPYLKQVGWKGLVDGPDSGVYCVGPARRGSTRRRDGHAARPGGVRALLRRRSRRRRSDGPQAPRPPAPGHALGSADRAAVRGRAGRRAGHGPRGHLGPTSASSPTETPGRGRGHRGGAARHAHPPLPDRRAGPRHEGQPDRRARPTTTRPWRCRSRRRRAA